METLVHQLPEVSRGLKVGNTNYNCIDEMKVEHVCAGLQGAADGICI